MYWWKKLSCSPEGYQHLYKLLQRPFLTQELCCATLIIKNLFISRHLAHLHTSIVIKVFIRTYLCIISGMIFLSSKVLLDFNNDSQHHSWTEKKNLFTTRTFKKLYHYGRTQIFNFRRILSFWQILTVSRTNIHQTTQNHLSLYHCIQEM